MADLIERNAVISCLDSNAFDSYENAVVTLQKIKDIPTIEAEPVRHGRWIQYSRNADEMYIECSNCCVASRPRHLQMVTRTGSGLPDYCPNCGAQMDGGADNGWNSIF